MGRTPTHTTHIARRATGVLTVTLAALMLSACAGDDDDSGPIDAVAEVTAEPNMVPVEQSMADAGLAVEGEAGPGAAEAPADFDIGIVGRDVIVEMHVVLGTDDVERSVSSITARAAALGGGVASSDIRYGSDEPGEGYAVLVVKVPPEGLDRLINGLGDIGTIQSINQSAQDVHDQLVDLDVRIANARQSVANVREFMDRTENLTDLVTLEGELTRRQTELEQLEAQQRNLSDRVALSTVTIEVVPTATIPTEDDEPGTIADAFADGWDAFVGFTRGVVIVIAVLAPFLALALITGGVAWLIIRRKNRPEPPAPATHEDVHDDDGAVSDELVSASREG